MISSSDMTALIQAEHDTIIDEYPWPQRKYDSLITTVAPYSTGTLSSSGTTLTGVNTVWTSAMVNRYIRIGSNTFFSRITAFTSTTSLTIESALPSDAAAGSTYTIFQHLYNLPSNFGRATNITGDWRLREISRSDIDRVDPYRSSTASVPDSYNIRGLDPNTTSSQLYQIEFWPVPSAATAIRVEYLISNSLSADTDEPLYPGDVLVWKAAETGAYFLFGKNGDDAWSLLAERYHQRYVETLQSAKEDSLARYSPVRHVRDVGHDMGRGSGFWIEHDDLFLR